MNVFRKNILLTIAAVCLTTAGCAHHVAFKQPDTYQYSSAVPLKAAFYMDSSLKAKVYSSRSIMTGAANRWDTPVGDAVHKYATAYLQNGFADFSEIDTLSDQPDYDILIRIADINYYMEGQAAHSDIRFVVESSGGAELFNNQYHADGPSGAGRALMGGAFAQKSAIRQSTHVVMETIFKNFMDDVRADYGNWGFSY